MIFNKNENLSSRYVVPYMFLYQVKKVEYYLKLPSELSLIHPEFHVSILNKCISDPVYIVPTEGLGVYENLSYKEFPVEIIDRLFKNLRNKQVALVKVIWRNHLVE